MLCILDHNFVVWHSADKTQLTCMVKNKQTNKQIKKTPTTTQFRAWGLSCIEWVIISCVLFFSNFKLEVDIRVEISLRN